MKDSFPEKLQQPPEQDDFEALEEKLGFIETDDLAQIRKALVEANEREDDKVIQGLIGQYQVQGESIVNQQQGLAYVLAQIGLMIATATLRRDIGKTELALEDIEAAAEYAKNMGMDAVAEELLASSEIAGTLALLECDAFDYKTLCEIAVLPFDEGFAVAYGYLIQAGLDADGILSPFMKK